MLKARDQIGQFKGDMPVEPASDELTRSEAAALEPAGESETQPDLQPALAQGLASRLAGLKSKIEERLDSADLAPDLAQDIGSGRWFRGIATMLGLGLVAISFWPDLTEVEAATAMPVDGEVRDEFRSQMIMPLALGADSGRHMGATPNVLPLKSAPERPMIQLVATLGQGDSFGRMLERAGVGMSDISQVSALVGNAMPLGDIEPGTQFDITLGKRSSQNRPRPLDHMDFRARFDLELAVARSGGQLGLRRHQIMVDATPLRITGRVGSSLYRSARAAGAPIKAIQQYLQAIDDHVNLESDIRAGDQYDIIIAYKRSAKGERQAGDLLYAGLDRGSKPLLQLMRWGKDGQFFEADGIGKQRSTYVMPVAGRVTSGFGMRRHPILGYRRMHYGIDYAARYGTPIYAVSDGVVSYSGRHGGHGNFVRIDHGGGLATGYAHMSRIAVSKGSRVHAGQVIGYVGSTGLSTGPHLHFEVYRNNHPINPAGVRFVARPQIDGQELAKFKETLAKLKSVKPGAALESIAPQQAAPAEPEREIDRLADHREIVAPAPAQDGAEAMATRRIDGGLPN